MVRRFACCLALAPLSDGCGWSCTEAGCASALALTVRSSSGWPPGQYRIDFTADDGFARTCSVALPRDRTVRAGMDCLPAVPQVVAPCAESSGAAGAAVQNCPQPPPEILFGATLPEAPRTLHVRIAHEGTTLLDQSITPDYSTIRPNGEHCDPVCRFAKADLSLP